MNTHLADHRARPQIDLRFGPAGLGLVRLPALALLLALWLAGVAGYARLAIEGYGAVIGRGPFLGEVSIRLGPASMGALISSLPLVFFTFLTGLLGANLRLICWAEDRIVLDQHSLRVYARATLRAVSAVPQTQRNPHRLYALADERLVRLPLHWRVRRAATPLAVFARGMAVAAWTFRAPVAFCCQRLGPAEARVRTGSMHGRGSSIRRPRRVKPMNLRIFLALACAVVVSGCAISQDITPTPPEQRAQELCLVRNSQVVQDGFHDVYVRVLERKDIKVRTLPDKSPTTACLLVGTYEAIYLARADLGFWADGKEAGRAVYDSLSGGANMNKFIRTELVDQLFRRLKSLPSLPLAREAVA